MCSCVVSVVGVVQVVSAVSRAGNLGRLNIWDGQLFHSEKEKCDPSCPNG